MSGESSSRIMKRMIVSAPHVTLVMASQVGRLIQEQNFNVHLNGSSVVGKSNNAIKAQKKGGLGGRKPLGDVSNSGKPVPTQALKKLDSKNLTFIKEVAASTKVGHRKANNGKSISRDLAGASRKALSDISNSKTAHLRDSSKNKNATKLNVLEGEQHLFPSSIAEEQYLHNHQECIKAQTKLMDTGQFLTTIGPGNAAAKQSESPWLPSLSCKKKPENSSWNLELEEMPEHPFENMLSSKRNVSPPCKTPKGPTYNFIWKDCDSVNFKLMETP